jgi:hypothetical protein
MFGRNDHCGDSAFHVDSAEADKTPAVDDGMEGI